jgi:hypothetical protein
MRQKAEREGNDVREGSVCSQVLCLEGVRVNCAGVEVESWDVTRLIRVSESARRERETRSRE